MASGMPREFLRKVLAPIEKPYCAVFCGSIFDWYSDGNYDIPCETDGQSASLTGSA
jgi:hypothetical protein